jgi:hypothetical protein
MATELKRNFQAVFLLFPAFFFSNFIYSVNVSIHPWRIYETFPVSFLSTLKDEQRNAGYPGTVGGHRVREFVYGFMNYNSGEKLNHITAPEALQMNCDYAIAYKRDKPWYDNYYSELAVEDYWDFTLLKRRRPIARKLLYELPSATGFEGSQEYFNAYERFDISFNSENPVLAEFDFGIDASPKPFRAWLVLQIDGDDGNNIFVRTPLDLVKLNWNGAESFITCITSGNIPVKIKRIVAYLWNIEKTEVKFRLNGFRLYQLDGEGITEVSQANL